VVTCATMSFQSQDEEALEVLRELEASEASGAPALQEVLPLATAVDAPPVPDARPEPASQTQHRRLRGKQTEPAGWQTPAEQAMPADWPTPAEQAIADEAWHELVLLEKDGRRQHMHWVHTRTTNPADKQPEDFTRAEFFDHMLRCYVDVYPEPANRHKCIALFGTVAKEKHLASNKDGERYEHHHSTMYCSKRHYWKPVAEVSYNKYKVKLHAATHSGYASMHLGLAHFLG
jgi:hypothetical protein